MEMQFGESFDMETSADINVKKQKKKFWLIVILSAVILGTLFTLLFVFKYQDVKVPPVEEMNEKFSANGELFYNARSNVIKYQTSIVENRKEKYKLVKNIFNNGYISNTRITIYDDGVYLKDYEEAFNGNYRNVRSMGNIDTTLIDNYTDENREALLQFNCGEIEKGADIFTDGFFIRFGNKAVVGSPIENPEIYNKLFELYNQCEKEEIQSFDLSDK